MDALFIVDVDDCKCALFDLFIDCRHLILHPVKKLRASQQRTAEEIQRECYIPGTHHQFTGYRREDHAHNSIFNSLNINATHKLSPCCTRETV